MAENASRRSERLPGIALVLILSVILIGGAGNYRGLDGWWRRRR